MDSIVCTYEMQFAMRIPICITHKLLKNSSESGFFSELIQRLGMCFDSYSMHLGLDDLHEKSTPLYTLARLILFKYLICRYEGPFEKLNLKVNFSFTR